MLHPCPSKAMSPDREGPKGPYVLLLPPTGAVTQVARNTRRMTGDEFRGAAGFARNGSSDEVGGVSSHRRSNLDSRGRPRGLDDDAMAEALELADLVGDEGLGEHREQVGDYRDRQRAGHATSSNFTVESLRR